MVKTAYFGLLYVSFLFSQEFVVQPYLQSPTWSTMYILWETDSNSDTRVEWGTWPTLGEVTTGTAITTSGSNKLHTVLLTELHTSMRYYYRVITGSLTSEIYDFIMPSDPMEEASFKIVAMSDMQKHAYLTLNPGNLITDGLMAKCRNTNYFGELLIYLSFALMTQHWIPLAVLATFVAIIWLPNMRRKDKSLSRYPEYEEYKKRSSLLIPFLW